MKLDRIAIAAVALVSVASVACGSRPAPPPSAPAAPVVGTTQLMAAELGDFDDAPRVGKSRHSRDDAAFDDVDETAKEPSRRGEHRRAGGFSGYK